MYFLRTMPTIRYTKNGAIRFLRIGRMQFTFCFCKRSVKR